MLPIFIGTTSTRRNWLEQCTRSLGARTFTPIADVAMWELGKIKHIHETYRHERFLFLHDSVEILSERFFELTEETTGSVALFSDPVPFGMFMGIFERTVLDQVPLWQPVSQEASVRAELLWTTRYARAAKSFSVLFPEVSDRAAIRSVHRFGRTNLVLENEHIRKYKATWGVAPHALRTY
jgi:hypothetical protein